MTDDPPFTGGRPIAAPNRATSTRNPAQTPRKLAQNQAQHEQDRDDPELRRLAMLFDGKGFDAKDREWPLIGRLQRAGLVRVQTTSRTTATVWARYQASADTAKS